MAVRMDHDWRWASREEYVRYASVPGPVFCMSQQSAGARWDAQCAYFSGNRLHHRNYHGVEQLRLWLCVLQWGFSLTHISV